MKSGWLASAKIISGNTYAANTKIIFDTAGNLIQGKTASTHVSSHNYVIKGNAFSFSSAPRTHYISGVVTNGYLATASTGTKVVDTVIGATNTFSFRWSINFHTTGVVKSGSLATASVDTKVGGDGATNTFSFKATSIDFHENGVVSGGYLPTNKTIGSYTYVANTKIFF